MNNEQIEDLVDLMFNTDMEEVMKEKSILEYIHKLQQENKQLKEKIEDLEQKGLTENGIATMYKEKIDKAIEYIKHYGNLYCLKHTQFKKYKQYEELLEILGDKE